MMTPSAGLRWLLFACVSAVVAADSNFLTVTLKTDSNSRYIVPINMGPVGTPQALDIALSMGTSYISVVGTSCTTCNGSTAYDESKSTTAKTLSGSSGFTLIGGASTSGNLITEDCRLPADNGSLWSYPNQTVVVASNSTDLFNNKVSGVLGLQTGTANSALYNASVIGAVFGRNPAKSSVTYGLALQHPLTNNTGAGSLHWLGTDTSAYNTGTVIMKNTSLITSPITSTAGAGTQITVFELDGWNVSVSGSNTVQSVRQNIQAALDPYYPAIYFPADQTALIYATISGSSSTSGDNGQSTIWTIPCSTKFSLSSTIGGRSFSLDQSQLVQKNSDGTCSSFIRGWSDTSTELYLFGSTFISSLYLIVQVANPSSGQSDQIGFATRVVTSSSSTNVGAIVGGVVGGVVALALICVGIFFLVRRKSHAREVFGAGTYVPEQKVEPYVYPPQSPNGQEPYSAGSMSSPTANAPLLPPSYNQTFLGETHKARV